MHHILKGNLLKCLHVVPKLFPPHMGKAKHQWTKIDVCLSKALNMNKTENMSCSELSVKCELSLGDLTLFLNMSEMAHVCYGTNLYDSYPG